MGSDNIYTKKEISKILAKASQIQIQKDLYGDREGLSEQEILELADEVGIDRSSLIEAIYTFDIPDFENKFKWSKATSKIQDVSYVNGEVSNEIWEEVIHEIRKITGGIGRSSQTGKSFEWEQRKREFGYKHISFTPENGKTKIQYVHNWTSLKASVLFLSFFFGLVFMLIALKGIGMPKSTAVVYAPLGGLVTFSGGLLFLKYHFNREKRKIKTMIGALSKKFKSTLSGTIKIEDKEVYKNEKFAKEARDKTT